MGCILSTMRRLTEFVRFRRPRPHFDPIQFLDPDQDMVALEVETPPPEPVPHQRPRPQRIRPVDRIRPRITLESWEGPSLMQKRLSEITLLTVSLELESAEIETVKEPEEEELDEEID